MDAAAWADGAELAPHEIDCAIALMLKIIDGKCRMDDADKAMMAVLYDRVKSRPSRLLGDAEHQLIAATRSGADEAQRLAVYERRVLAETMISRPVMKAWKARLREAGVLAPAEAPLS
ncbi:MAG: hypothetical protein AB1899_15135 [Pseudomonadota bacterium]